MIVLSKNGIFKKESAIIETVLSKGSCKIETGFIGCDFSE
jgi:hypothetical protein